MVKIIATLIVIISTTLSAQYREFTIGTGFSQYFGDLTAKYSNKKIFLFGEISTMRMCYSLSYRYNFPEKFSVGFNFNHCYLAGYDSNNEATSQSDPGIIRKNRNLSFHTEINELFVDFRYEPFRTNKSWDRKQVHFSPYLGIGIGAFFFNPKTILTGSEFELYPLSTEGQGAAGYPNKYGLFQLIMPMNIGIKMTPISRMISISLELSYHHAFTDYIDDVSGSYVNINDYSKVQSQIDPISYGLFIPLNDRRKIKNQTSEDRGNNKDNDFFITGLLKFSFNFINNEKTYFKCCDF